MSKSTDVNYKKVCAVLVEGPSDKKALYNILSKLFWSINKKVRVYVFHKDITSDNKNNITNIESEIISFIASELGRDKLEISDIYSVIHITDLDGCYIDENNVVYDNTCTNPLYDINNIKTNRVAQIQQRNKQKSKNIDHLLTVKNIKYYKYYKNGKYDEISVPYKLYFMSCNLDHVLYNKNNLTDEEKTHYAESFAEHFLDAPTAFIEFLKKEGITIEGTYEDSWNFIKKENNSLKRKTNLDKAF